MPLIVFQISEVALFLLKKDSSLKKAPNAKIEGFQISIFDLNQTVKFGFFPELTGFTFVFKILGRI